jgi:hypothetical protein
MQEDDALIWSLYGSVSQRKRLRLLRTLRRQYSRDLTDAKAEVVALRQRLLLIKGAIADYTSGDKRG